MIELQYQADITEDIRQCIDRLGRRPILFIGSGASIRYCGLPDWVGLLDLARANCPTLDKGIAYYIQSFDGDLPAIASSFATAFHDFAWSELGRHTFPDNLFTRNASKDTYLKYTIAAVIKTRQDNKFHVSLYDEELEALKRIMPFSIITTNYDTHLQNLFPQYQVTIGEQVFIADLTRIGDLLKIHGCLSDPDSIIITKEDYDTYKQKRRYLSAKLLTYFLEHPILFIGYSVNDENIRDILADVDLVLAKDGALIENIYILSHCSEPSGKKEATIRTTGDRHIRVKQIQAQGFDWVYNAFTYKSPLTIDVGALRDLESTILRLTRTDIPAGKMSVDYDTLRSLANSDSDTLKLLGLGPLTSVTQSRIHYRYTLSQIAQELGFSYWHYAQLLIDRVKVEKGFDIKSSDNIYHCGTRYGKNTIHEYSDDLLALLRNVRDGLEYELSLS